jgi:hypothetical protein
MVLTDKRLSSGRKVKIKQLTIDEMDECRDTQKIIFKDDATILTDTNKARTKWIRKGLAGGEFKNYKSDNNEPTDGVLKLFPLILPMFWRETIDSNSHILLMEL